MKPHQIAVIAGDGIGKEVVPEGVRALEAAARKFGIPIEWREFDWSCDYYAKHGRMMPEDWFETLSPHDAIFFGAVGWPATVPDHVSLWGSLIPFRRRFDQYVNLRPCRLMPGIPTPAREPQAGRHRFRRRPREHRGRILVGRRPDVRGHRARDRVPGVGVLAQGRGPHPRVRIRARRQAPCEAPDVRDQVERHLDHDAVLGRALPRNGGAVPGHPRPTSTTSTSSPRTSSSSRTASTSSSAPTSSATSSPISGPRCAEPSASRRRPTSIRSASFRRCSSRCTARRPTSPARASRIRSARSGRARLMLEHLGHADAAAAVVGAIERVLADPSAPRTPDIGGRATTTEVGKAIAAAI